MRSIICNNTAAGTRDTNRTRRWGSFVVMAVVLSLCLPGISSAAQNVKFPRPSGFVNDYSNVMTPESKRQVEFLLKRVEEKTSVEIVVVTVKSTVPLSLEQYAVELFQKWGIGKKGEDNGLLILVVTDDRKVRVEVGYGLEGVITDLESKIVIRDVMIPAFRNGNYSLGIAAGAVMFSKMIRDEYGVDLELGDVAGRLPDVPARGHRGSFLGSLFTFLIFVLIFGFRFGTLFFFMGGMGRRRSYWSGGSGGSFGGGFGGFGGGMSGGGGASGGW